MPFNPRLAPYSITKTLQIRETSGKRGTSQYFPIFRFPRAGQIIGAHANIRRGLVDATAKDAIVEATTNTGVDELSLWKHATDDTTATYATSLRSCIRTGAQDTSSAAAPGINWRGRTVATAVSGEKTLYALTNKSAARRKYNAGDRVLLHISPYSASTAAHIIHEVELQVDYILGEES